MDAVSPLYLDERLVAVNKPSGELVHPGWARGEPTTMARVRDALGARVHPAHRLDRGTSGVVLFARDPEAARALNESWPAVKKRYLALVRGQPPAGATIDHPVRKKERGDERVPAVTHFVRLGVSSVARCALVDVTLDTGRLHQIRRHFKHISHPLIGDVRYGKGDINRAFRETWGFHRLALHAWRVELVHPITGAALDLVAPLPDELGQVLSALGLADVLPARLAVTG